MSNNRPLGITEKLKEYFDQQEDVKGQPSISEDEEARRLKSLQKVGIKVMPATKRYSRLAPCIRNAVKKFACFSTIDLLKWSLVWTHVQPF